jgi:hypothetical protein
MDVIANVRDLTGKGSTGRPRHVQFENSVVKKEQISSDESAGVNLFSILRDTSHEPVRVVRISARVVNQPPPPPPTHTYTINVNSFLSVTPFH